MPGVGTHTTIVQYLAKQYAESAFGAALGDPDKNSNWTDYESDAGLLARYAVLGAMGPDIFYAMLDYKRSWQDFEDVAIKIAGTFQCLGEISQEINNYVNGTLDKLTDGAWKSIKDTVKTLNGIMLEGILATVIENANLWTEFLPPRQIDAHREKWYWADYLHYVHTGRFARKLLDNCRQYYQVPAARDSRATRFLTAYTLGYLTHYVADTIGHAYVNRIVQAPWRNCWQRHHLVENFIDAFLWEQWHDGQPEPDEPSTEEQPLDVILTAPAGKTMPAPYRYSRLNDLCNIGSAGIDPIIDGAIAGICQKIQNRMFDFGLTQVPDLQAPDDPAFITWTEFLADAIVQTYPPGDQPTNLASSPPKAGADGYPTPADIAAAYGAYRLVLSFATEDDVKRPEPPDVLGDLWKLISDAWNSVVKDLGSIPPPPPLPGSSGFSLPALIAAAAAYARWAGQVAEAVLKAAGDLIEAGFQLGVFPMTETAKVLLYLLNVTLYSVYSQIRFMLVMQAYSAPATGDLTAMWGPLDLRQLWTITGEGPEHYPFEPVVSQRDLIPDPTHPDTPYYPYLLPSALPPAHIEFPPTTLHEAMRRWGTPDDMLTAPIGPADQMFSAAGPAPPVLVPMTNPDGSSLADAESFDGSQRYFGGIFDNCAAALETAFGYLTSGVLPEGWEFPDYNLDSDRGFAWPCWDVDYAAPGTIHPYPWNGCDPFPADTIARGKSPTPARTDLKPVDPWGHPRDGMAWINAAAIPAPSGYFDFAFPSIAVDPTAGDVDPCQLAAVTEGSPPGVDYHVCKTGFLLNSQHAGDPDFVGTENDGRLIDYLRLQAVPPNPDPVTLLATATALAAGRSDPEVLGGPPLPFPLPPDPTPLVTAVAQLAVTGRRMFTAFAASPPQDQNIADTVTAAFPGLDPARVLQDAHDVLDIAYTALWSIRSNDPGWRAYRFGLGWIAVSGCDDTPHRPVNVPTAPYPQFDLPFTVPQLGTDDDGTGPQVKVTTRYMIAQAYSWVGPDDPAKSSFTDPDPNLLQAPAGPFSATPAPRSVPDDTPAISPTSKIIIYVHGGGSRAEEAVGMASYLITEGAAVGEEYTVISFDLPNSAYAAPFDVSVIASSQYHPSRLHVLHFEEQFIINFIEALDTRLGNVKGRIVAVMGGSLGGNMSLLLTQHSDEKTQQGARVRRSYLDTMIAWSATATATATYLGLVKQGPVAAAKLRGQVTDQEVFADHATESGYLHDLYFNQLVPGATGVTPVVPPQPLMWYRAGQPDAQGNPDWLRCKQAYIAQSRYDRYEIYSVYSRHWAIAIDLEQIWFSFQEPKDSEAIAPKDYEAIAWPPNSRLLLIAGEWDNYNPVQIFNSTIDVTRMIRRPVGAPPPRGKAEFWTDTGHSFHDERPHLFASEIVYFLTHPDAGDSPHGTVVSTPQRAPFAETAQ